MPGEESDALPVHPKRVEVLQFVFLSHELRKQYNFYIKAQARSAITEQAAPKPLSLKTHSLLAFVHLQTPVKQCSEGSVLRKVSRGEATTVPAGRASGTQAASPRWGDAVSFRSTVSEADHQAKCANARFAPVRDSAPQCTAARFARDGMWLFAARTPHLTAPALR